MEDLEKNLTAEWQKWNNTNFTSGNHIRSASIAINVVLLMAEIFVLVNMIIYGVCLGKILKICSY